MIIGKQTQSLIIKLLLMFVFIIIINVGVRATLRTLRLISRVLKLIAI
jgi:hypothetical protein